MYVLIDALRRHRHPDLARSLRQPGVSHVRRIGRHVRRLLDDGRGHDASRWARSSRRSTSSIMWVTIGNGLRFGPRYLLGRGRPCVRFVPRASSLTTPYWHRTRRWRGVFSAALSRFPLYLDLAAARVDARDRGSAPRQRGEEPLPREHEPRVPHAAERHRRHVRAPCDDAPQRRAARMLGRASRPRRGRCSTLVEDVLDISAIEVGKLKRQRSRFRSRRTARAASS